MRLSHRIKLYKDISTENPWIKYMQMSVSAFVFERAYGRFTSVCRALKRVLCYASRD